MFRFSLRPQTSLGTLTAVLCEAFRGSIHSMCLFLAEMYACNPVRLSLHFALLLRYCYRSNFLLQLLACVLHTHLYAMFDISPWGWRFAFFRWGLLRCDSALSPHLSLPKFMVLCDCEQLRSFPTRRVPLVTSVLLWKGVKLIFPYLRVSLFHLDRSFNGTSRCTLGLYTSAFLSQPSLLLGPLSFLSTFLQFYLTTIPSPWGCQ